MPAAPTDLDLTTEAGARYARWPDKGDVAGGRRLTIMVDRTAYQPGDEVTVWHVVEVTEPGASLYVMGPKPVFDEYVDDRLAGPALPADADPFEPLEYDGRVLPGPGTDTNYQRTTYRLDEPGPHTVQWRLGGLASNVVTLTVD